MLEGFAGSLRRQCGGLAAALLACALAVSASGASGGVTVTSAHNRVLGQTIMSAGGRTLYHASSEKRGTVSCTGTCTSKWRPLLISALSKPRAGSGVSASMLGTIKRPDGRLQVTYHGLALYLFSGDTRAGEVNGEGVGGIWHALAPSGAAVLEMSSGGSSSSASSGGTSGGSGASSTTSSGSSGGSSTGTGSGSVANAGMWCAANPSQCVNGVPITGTTTTG